MPGRQIMEAQEYTFCETACNSGSSDSNLDELCVATSLLEYRNSAGMSDQTIEEMRLHLKKTMADDVVDKMDGATLKGHYVTPEKEQEMRLQLKKTMEHDVVDKMDSAQLKMSHMRAAAFDQGMEAKYRKHLGKHKNNYAAAQIDVMVVVHEKRGPLSGSRMEAAKAFLGANGVTREKLEEEDYAPAAIRAYVLTTISMEVKARSATTK